MLFSDNLKLCTQDGSKLTHSESTIANENDGITIPGIIYKYNIVIDQTLFKKVWWTL